MPPPPLQRIRRSGRAYCAEKPDWLQSRQTLRIRLFVGAIETHQYIQSYSGGQFAIGIEAYRVGGRSPPLGKHGEGCLDATVIVNQRCPVILLAIDDGSMSLRPWFVEGVEILR